MKNLFACLLILVSSLAAFAQGKIGFQTDSLHLVYYDPSTFGPPFGGTAVYDANAPAGIHFLADLYIGTSSSSLSLISSTTFGSASPGKWNAMSVQVPGILGGTTVFVMAQVRDDAHAAESVWTPGFAPPSISW